MLTLEASRLPADGSGQAATAGTLPVCARSRVGPQTRTTYGRPGTASGPQDLMEIEPGDLVEIRRLLLESISVEHQEPGEPADDLLGSPSLRLGRAVGLAPPPP